MGEALGGGGGHMWERGKVRGQALVVVTLSLGKNQLSALQNKPLNKIMAYNKSLFLPLRLHSADGSAGNATKAGSLSALSFITGSSGYGGPTVPRG